MLNIALDPSIVEIKNNIAVFSCTIAGMSEVYSVGEEVPSFKSQEALKRHYFPWNWTTKNHHIIDNARLIWIGNNIEKKEVDGNIKYIESIDYRKIGEPIKLIKKVVGVDGEKLSNYYENCLEKIHDDTNFHVGMEIDPEYSLKEEYITKGKFITDSNFEFLIGENNNEFESISELEKESFLRGFISYAAQQLPPLNEALNLSLFFEAKDFSIPVNATHFLLYFEIGNFKNIPDGFWDNNFNTNAELNIPVQVELKDNSENNILPNKIAITQPLTSLASYQVEDFIGQLKELDEISDRLKNRSWDNLPANVKDADFIFKGNLNLEVCDISELNSAYSEFFYKHSFSILLRKLIIERFKSRVFTDSEEKITSVKELTADYINKIFENEFVYNNHTFDKNIINISSDLEFPKPDVSIKDYFNSPDKVQETLEEIKSLSLDDDNAIERWEKNLERLYFQIIDVKAFLIYLHISDGYENDKIILAEDINKEVQNDSNNEDKFTTEIKKISKSSFKSWKSGVLAKFKYFLGDDLKFNAENELDEKIEDNIILLFEEGLESIPPPVNIYIENLKKTTLDNLNELQKSDLLDEISGYIVLSRRSDKSGNFGEAKWHYLNWAKVALINKERSQNSDAQGDYLTGDYLIPALLPEINNQEKLLPENYQQKATFQLSNESLSLVAGHNNLVEDTMISQSPNFIYTFGPDNENKFVPAAPAFWYGHHYEFAGFAALNSGALPAAIRGNDDMGMPIYNKPKLDNISFKDDQISKYQHLRRVPVGLPNIKVDKKYFNRYPDVPLLVNELLDNDRIIALGETENEEKIKAFLLCDNINQNEITIKVDKPYTNFWNWYAWRGNESKSILISGTDGKKRNLLDFALEKELEIKAKSFSNGMDKDDFNPYLWEPSIENELVVKIEQVFPTPPQGIVLKDIILEVRDLNGKSIPDSFVIKADDIVGVLIDKKNISIPPGTICKISIHCKVKKNLFNGAEPMFYPWMNKHVVQTISEKKDDDMVNFYLTHPEVIYIESAIKNTSIPLPINFNNLLYDGFKPDYSNVSEGGVYCTLNNNGDEGLKNIFPYFSRCEVKHQAWHWNGRLFAELADTEPPLDPLKDGETTEAMKWEAWEFANRPDFTALVSDAQLVTNKLESNKPIGGVNQIIFKDVRPQNDAQKAHYFRFGLRVFNRYESIGTGYNEGIQAQSYKNTWRRLLKPLIISDGENNNQDEIKPTDNQLSVEYPESSKTSNERKIPLTSTKLPKPAIRFAIPLTDALEVNPVGHDKVRAASMMIATYDRCFDEAGLAERFEVGIEVGFNQNDGYLQTGEDPILSDKAMGPLSKEEVTKLASSPDGRKFMVFNPVGPAALTFDTAAHHPKVVGSTFILNVEDIQQFLPEGTTLKAYSMAKIAIRRVLDKRFVEYENGDKIESKEELQRFNSEWSASEWVQFLPSVDSLIPKIWKEMVLNNGSVKFEITKDGDKQEITFEGKMPLFDDIFENRLSNYDIRMERYLVISQRINDIGGQPVEKYVGVYKWHNTPRYDLKFTLDDGEQITKGVDFNGFARLMLVRRSIDNGTGNNNDNNINIWGKLFGEKASKQVQFGAIENDPLAAMPLVSKRIAIKMEK